MKLGSGLPGQCGTQPPNLMPHAFTLSIQSIGHVVGVGVRAAAAALAAVNKASVEMKVNWTIVNNRLGWVELEG